MAGERLVNGRYQPIDLTNEPGGQERAAYAAERATLMAENELLMKQLRRLQSGR